MNIREGELVWTKKEAVKSVLLFTLNFLILVLIVGILLLWNSFGNFSQTFRENRANYLYIMFCTLLLVWILYFYFFFENRRMLTDGKNIALVFSVLDFSIVVSFLFGNYLHIYARPVALCALLMFILVGRREAVFVNMVCAILLFIVDAFSDNAATANSVYSSFIIAFTAGMIAIFFGNKAKTRFQIVGIGLIIVIPVDVIIFLLEISGLAGAAPSLPTEATGLERVLTLMGYGLLGGIMSAVLFLAFLPGVRVRFQLSHGVPPARADQPGRQAPQKAERRGPGYVQSFHGSGAAGGGVRGGAGRGRRFHARGGALSRRRKTAPARIFHGKSGGLQSA